MADTQNGAAPEAVGGEGNRELYINAQYVKDLSFENPRAPQSLLQAPQQPEVQLGVDVKAQNLAPNLYEVVLTVHAEAKANSERIFLVELAYAGVVTLNNMTEADLPRALLVETPRLMFPFARSVVANAVRDGGYMPLLLNPIDFSELLQRQPVKSPDGVITV